MGRMGRMGRMGMAWIVILAIERRRTESGQKNGGHFSVRGSFLFLEKG